MESGDSKLIFGAEIHGFHTAADLDVDKLMQDASTRWFRPNEVHAILSNYTLFKVQPQPVDKPPSGSVLLFDRKMLRNFRKDGYIWKKKKDGKTVQEAHEKLKLNFKLMKIVEAPHDRRVLVKLNITSISHFSEKAAKKLVQFIGYIDLFHSYSSYPEIGNEERIHVYYARSEDDSSFYRRCYWLLDKNLERIVLVHYRQTSEENALPHQPAPVECIEASPLKNDMQYGSPLTPVNSTSAQSEVSGTAVISEEINSGCGISLEDTELQKHELSLHEINTLDWAALVGSPTINDSPMNKNGEFISHEQMQNGLRSSIENVGFLLSPDGGISSQYSTDFVSDSIGNEVNQAGGGYYQAEKVQDSSLPLFAMMDPNDQVAEISLDDMGGSRSTNVMTDDVFVPQNNFGGCNYVNDDSLGLSENLKTQIPTSNGHLSNALTAAGHSLGGGSIFNISDVSPGWAYSTEETKVLLVGFFHESQKHLLTSNIYCVFGEKCVTAEMVQPGVYRCTALPQPPGIVNLFLSMDGKTPISQVLHFDYRCSPKVEWNGGFTSLEDDGNKIKWKDYQVKARLAHLLFNTTNNVSILSNTAAPKSLKEVKRFSQLTTPSMEKEWTNFLKLSENEEASSQTAALDLLELVLRNKLQEWLLEKVAEGCQAPPRDKQGQGAIHLCAISDYTRAVRLFSLSGMSLDFRDSFGWTALHWAAYFGRENMVATLLSAGANPSLVTDPTSEFPGGCTAADLASKQGYQGLAAYLAEWGLTAHFKAMSLAGNVTGYVRSNSTAMSHSEDLLSWSLSEQELCLKESLAAYRNAADAADRIQAAIRERALKLQTRAVELVKPEIEASEIVSAMKIQHAFRNYNRRKLMKAAARIQSHFRTWKTRKNFLHMRRQVIKIQAAFRGHQVRKQYRKIVWSVGILEKAILRWRLKRKGLRGIQLEATEAMKVDMAPENTGEEEFHRISREQAEERVSRSVVKVQAMFRSYQAQQEYRRMKLAYDQAKLELSDLSQDQ